MYRTLKKVWHSKDQCYYAPGTKISLVHLTGTDVERLIALGIVKRIPKAVVKPKRKYVRKKRKSNPLSNDREEK